MATKPKRTYNVQNLKTRHLTSEEAAEMSKKAVAAKRVYAQKRAMGQALARAILAENIPQDAKLWEPLRKMLADAGFVADDVNFEKAMHIVQLVNALKEGDVKAYTALLKVAGLMEEKHDVNLHEDIIITFGE